MILTIYFAVGLALEEFADLFRSSFSVQPWDPAAGWNVLLLLGFGVRYAPAIFLVAFFEDVISIVIQNESNSIIAGLVSGIWLAVVYGITAAIFKYKLDFKPDLKRQKDIFQFVVYWTIAALIAAILLYTTLLSLNQIEASQWWGKVLQEWVGEATGIMMLAVPILILLRPLPWSNQRLTIAAPPPEFEWSWLRNRRLLWTWVGFVVLAVLFSVLAYGDVYRQPGLEYTYFAFVPLTIVTAWKGFEQGCLMIFLINVFAVLLTYQTAQSQNVNGTALQFGLMTLTYVGIFLGAITTSHQQESSQRQRSDQQLRYDATHDSLTGLYNRAWLFEQLRQTIAQAETDQDYHFALLFLDLDRFKSVNDRLGHIIGDRLLVEVGRRLKECSPRNKKVVRLGGDEFVILLEEITDLDWLRLAARAIVKDLSQVYTIDSHEIYTSTSIGITYSEFDYHSPEDILRDADIALYQAKTRGRSQYVLFDRQMYRQAMRRLALPLRPGSSQLEHDLRRIIQQFD